MAGRLLGGGEFVEKLFIMSLMLGGASSRGRSEGVEDRDPHGLCESLIWGFWVRFRGRCRFECGDVFEIG